MNCQKRVPSFFLLQELQKEIPVGPLAPLAKGSWRAAPERSSPPQRPYGTSPPRSARHLPLTRGGIGSAAPPLGSPCEGELAPQATERSSPPQRPYGTSPPRSARHLPLTRGGIGSAAPPLGSPCEGELAPQATERSSPDCTRPPKPRPPRPLHIEKRKKKTKKLNHT